MQHIVHLYPPARIHLRTDVVPGREIVAIGIELQAFVDGKASVIQHFAVHENLSPEQMHAVSRHSDDAFYKMLLRMDRITKDDDIAAMDRRIRHQPIPDAAFTVMNFIDQQVVADQQRIFHGFRRNLESLREESDNEYGQYNRGTEPLDPAHPVIDFFSAAPFNSLCRSGCGNLWSIRSTFNQLRAV